MSGRSAGDEPPSPGEPLDPERWRRLVQAVLGEEGQSGELDVTFVDEARMTELNAEHMGHEGPTDVLAFPIDGESDGPWPDRDGVTRLLGDVVICPGVARRNAPDNSGSGHDGSVEAELELLVVHGVLHVLGWGHATADRRDAMQARERHHLGRWRRAEHHATGLSSR